MRAFIIIVFLFTFINSFSQQQIEINNFKDFKNIKFDNNEEKFQILFNPNLEWDSIEIKGVKTISKIEKTSLWDQDYKNGFWKYFEITPTQIILSSNEIYNLTSKSIRLHLQELDIDTEIYIPKKNK